jgi:hypothetical protein
LSYSRESTESEKGILRELSLFNGWRAIRIGGRAAFLFIQVWGGPGWKRKTDGKEKLMYKYYNFS